MSDDPLFPTNRPTEPASEGEERTADTEQAAERGAIRSALAGRRTAYVAGLTAAAGAAATAGVVVVVATRSRGGKVGQVGWPLGGRRPQAVGSLAGAILTRSPQGQ